MEREGKREAEDRKNKAEDASRGMLMFLGCGKRLEDGRTDSRRQKTKVLTLQERDGRTNGRIQEIDSPRML